MGFVDEMDNAWTNAQQSSNVHAVRQHMTSARDDLVSYQQKIQDEVNEGKFDSVHVDIRNEGLVVKAIIDNAVTELANHIDFLDWKQPVD